MLKFQIILLCVSVVFLAVICESIRRRKLNEKYAFLWLITACVFLLFSIFPWILLKISDLLGLYYLTALIGICFFFLMLIAFSYAVNISKLAEQNKNLAQEIAILKNEVKRLG